MVNARTRFGARLTGLAVGLLVLLAVIFAPRLRSPSLLPTVPPTAAGDPAALAAGKSIFEMNCAVCHGVDGKGDGPAAAGLNPAPADFTDPIHRAHTDADLIGWISNGLPGSAMPAFAGKLTLDQMNKVIVFLRSLSANAPLDSSSAPDPSTCTIKPKDPASFRTPDASPAPQPTANSAVGPDYSWPQGVPATKAETDGITSAIREFYACANASDYERQIALYTDRFIAPQFSALDGAGWTTTLQYAAAAKTPVAVLDRQSIAGILDVRQLPDGRVGAYIEALDPVNHPHQINAVVIFANQNGQWLIDEVHEDPSFLLAPSPTVSASQVPTGGIGTPAASGGLVFNLTQTTAGVALKLTDANGAPVTDATVTFVSEMMEMGMGVTTLVAQPNPAGVYTAAVTFPMAGTWRVTVQVARAGGATTSFAFLVPSTGSG